MSRLRDRLPLILSITALVVAIFGATPVGNAVTSVMFAKNAGKVDGLDASKTPKAGQLLALSKQKKYPATVIPKLPVGDLQGSACAQYGQKGTVDVQYVPDVNLFNVEARTMISIECAGVVPPDGIEPNDDPDSFTDIQGGDNLLATISPANDVDWFRFDMTLLCGFEPGLCDTGTQIGVQSTGDAVTFKGYRGNPADVDVDVDADGVTFWNTNSIDTGTTPFLFIEVKAGAPIQYVLTFTVQP